MLMIDGIANLCPFYVSMFVLCNTAVGDHLTLTTGVMRFTSATGQHYWFRGKKINSLYSWQLFASLLNEMWAD